MLLIEPFTKDTFIYEKYAYMNNGNDPILELGTDDRGYQKRILFDLDIANIIDRLDGYDETTPSKMYLRLKNAIVESPTKQSITFWTAQLNEDFDAGMGTYSGYNYYAPYDTGSIEGATWDQYSLGNDWTTVGGDYTQEASYSIDTNDPDININFLALYVKLWMRHLSGDTASGVILYTSESANTDLGSYKYYSTETNTVNNPFFEIYLKLDEETDVTGDLTFIDLDDSPILYSYNNPSIIHESDSYKFKIKCRKQYPDVNQYVTESILNTSNLINGFLSYKINNLTTGETFIDFNSVATLIYHSPDGYYFYIDFTNFPINTDYSIDVKVAGYTGSYTSTYDYKVYNDLINFKVID